MIILPTVMSRIAEPLKLFLVPLILLLGLLFGQANCSAFAQNKKIKLNETFTLQTGETAETKDSKLKVSLIATGREILETGEIEYAELQVISGKSKQTLKIGEADSRKRETGDFIIELINAESFGKGECELKISRRE